MCPDRHLEPEIHVWLPVIDLPLYQASHPLRLSLHTLRFPIHFVFGREADDVHRHGNGID
jgi:hypothetical protein